MNELKTIKLIIEKKGRLYFACKTQSGYNAKLRITTESQDLELGEHELLVEDASVRTKYGTDLIYIMKSSSQEKVFLKSAYNAVLVEKCKALGGVFDKEDKVWVFSSVVAEEVEELDFLYNSEMISVEITAKDELFERQGPITFCGYAIVEATGRDSGAKLCANVSRISGSYTSGGSSKNWMTEMQKGTILRLQAPKELLEKCRQAEEKEFEIKFI